jgi:hypothetical protein
MTTAVQATETERKRISAAEPVYEQVQDFLTTEAKRH